MLREANSKRGDETEQSLYEQLGAVNAVSMVVDRYSVLHEGLMAWLR